MTTTTFYRKANVSRADAAASLLARYPNADLVKFEAKKADADEALSAGVKVGEKVYAATIRMSEFPPSKDDNGSSSEESSDDAPPSDDSESSDDSSSDDESSDSLAPDFGDGGSDDGLGEEKPLKGDDGIISLLQQILDVVKGGGSLGAPDDLGADPMGDPGLSGDPLGDPGAVPDIGAPGQGEGLPAPGAPPLPPPVKPKSPVGVGAFAHYNAKQAEITVVRQNTTGQVGNKEIIAEARELYPTHTVAKIRRTGSAVVNGQNTNLPESKIAVVTLIAK
jgi:hypothetical protein